MFRTINEATVTEPFGPRTMSSRAIRSTVRARVQSRYDGTAQEPATYRELMRPDGLGTITGEDVGSSVSGMDTRAGRLPSEVDTVIVKRAERPWSKGPNGRPLGEATVVMADGTMATLLAPNSVAARYVRQDSYVGGRNVQGGWYVWGDDDKGAHAGASRRRKGGGRKPKGTKAMSNAERQRAYRARVKANREAERATARIADPGLVDRA